MAEALLYPCCTHCSHEDTLHAHLDPCLHCTVPETRYACCEHCAHPVRAEAHEVPCTRCTAAAVRARPASMDGPHEWNCACARCTERAVMRQALASMTTDDIARAFGVPPVTVAPTSQEPRVPPYRASAGHDPRCPALAGRGCQCVLIAAVRSDYDAVDLDMQDMVEARVAAARAREFFATLDLVGTALSDLRLDMLCGALVESALTRLRAEGGASP